MKKYIVFAVVVLIFLVVAFLVTTKAQSASYTSTQKNKELAHEIANMMRYRGFPEDHPIIVACQDWWQEEDKKEEEIVEYTTKEQRWQHPQGNPRRIEHRRISRRRANRGHYCAEILLRQTALCGEHLELERRGLDGQT